MREISWVNAALKDFRGFPDDVRTQMMDGLLEVSAGLFPDFAKPLKGFDGGVYELALPYRGNAWRTVYALKIDNDIWVIHTFQKKSTSGIKTPKVDIDLIEHRIKQLRRVK